MRRPAVVLWFCIAVPRAGAAQLVMNPPTIRGKTADVKACRAYTKELPDFPKPKNEAHILFDETTGLFSFTSEPFTPKKHVGRVKPYLWASAIVHFTTLGQLPPRINLRLWDLGQLAEVHPDQGVYFRASLDDTLGVDLGPFLPADARLPGQVLAGDVLTRDILQILRSKKAVVTAGDGSFELSDLHRGGLAKILMAVLCSDSRVGVGSE